MAKKCTKCGNTYDSYSRLGTSTKSLIRLADSWTGRDVWCCPICKDDVYLVDKEVA